MKSKAETEAKNQEYLGNVQKAFSQLKTENYLSSVKMITEGIDKLEGGKHEFDAVIPDSVKEQVYQYAMQQIVAERVDPTDRKTIEQVFNNYLWALHGEKLSELRVRDALTKGYKAAIKENAGAIAHVGSNTPPIAERKSDIDLFFRER